MTDGHLHTCASPLSDEAPPVSTMHLKGAPLARLRATVSTCKIWGRTYQRELLQLHLCLSYTAYMRMPRLLYRERAAHTVAIPFQ